MNPNAPHLRRSLIVVDNDHDFADSICEWIGLSSDWLAVAAYGPVEAIARVGAAPPDAILLDMEMHGVDGFATADRLERASGAKHSVILALTGNAGLRDAASTDARFAASMLKPADPDGLLEILERIALRH